jgi:hypothetical protein
MTAVLAAPVFLGTSNYLSMNSFEPCFWMGALLVVLRIAEGSASPRAWLLFGLLAGLGIENKHSTVFFLIALLLGLLLSPQRRILWSKGCAAGVACCFCWPCPTSSGNGSNHFPTYELLNGVAHSDKNTKLPPLAFPARTGQHAADRRGSAVDRRPGLAGLRTQGPPLALCRSLLSDLPGHDDGHARQGLLRRAHLSGALRRRSRGLGQLTRRGWPPIVYTVILGYLLCRATAPIMLTILPPDKYTAYADHFGANKVKSEKFTSPLPQYLSDRFGWPQMVEGFAARYNALPPDVRARTAIFCGNYGEASAVNILGPKYGLPTAISGHQNYFYWGWNGYTGESVLTLGNDPKDYADNYAEVIDLGPFDAPWIMDHEHHHYFWLRHRKRTYAADWPEFKYWY